jgi:SAM-dependent methyltransferase
MTTAATLDDIIRQGHERLFPSLSNPNWLILRSRRRIFGHWLSQVPSPVLDVLDIGGRIQPYRALIAERTRRYIALDMIATPLVSVVAQAEKVPLRDCSFDLVICAQMLEYAADPSAVVKEIFRVLRPGGRLLLSVPSAAPIDSDKEYWRFLPGGLHHLLADFTQVQVVAEGGSIVGFFRTINVGLDIFMRYPASRFAYRHSLCPLINLSGALLEKISGGRNQQCTVNYSVLAIK